MRAYADAGTEVDTYTYRHSVRASRAMRARSRASSRQIAAPRSNAVSGTAWPVARRAARLTSSSASSWSGVVVWLMRCE